MGGTSGGMMMGETHGPSCLINEITLMRYMTLRIACYLRYGGLVDREQRRNFKGSILSPAFVIAISAKRTRAQARIIPRYAAGS